MPRIDEHYNTADSTLSLILSKLASITERVQPPVYLTSKQAAEYLGIPYGTFRHLATRITRMPGIKRYRREDLDSFASTYKPKRKR